MAWKFEFNISHKFLFTICLLIALSVFGIAGVKAAIDQNGPILQNVQFLPLTSSNQQLAQLIFDSQVKDPTVFMMTKPTRLVLDFTGVHEQLGQAQQTVNQGVISDYTVLEAGGRTRVVLNLNQDADYQTKVNGNVVEITLTAKTPTTAQATTKAATTTTVPATALPPPGGVVVTNPSNPGAPPKVYSGKLLSLNFQDIKVRAVLQLLAEFTGLNIVVSDTVQGSLTLHLENVPWDQALDIILQTQGLGKRQFGNVLLVAPSAEIAAREKQDLQAEQQLQDLAPLRSELLQINYGKASDIANLLEGNTTGGGGKGGNVTLLTTRGSVSFDARTNRLWIQDTPASVANIIKLVKQLDIPVRQVSISARIVNVNSNYLEDLGVRFGITQTNHITGTLEGANALAGGMPASAVSLAQRLSVDLPSTGGVGTLGTAGGPAQLGIALAHLGPGTLLDLELSALESEGGGQLISSPRLVTADQQAAVIQSGQEIPYQQASSSGATNVAFKNAVLSLSVTPQITPDGKVILTLSVNQDNADFTNEVGGVPPIDTRSIQSQVLVNNGETIVLGGIYETNDTNNVVRVPFLGSLPIVGTLFRHTTQMSTRTELLIFITPRILQQCADMS